MSDSDTVWRRIQLDPAKLIKSIKKRPMLYDKEDPHYYHNKRQKSMRWQDVCKEVIPNWEDMRPHERVECCHELQKRWKSLRTCFGREVSEQKKEEQRRQKNLPLKRRKVYGYFNSMSFLLPSYNMGRRPPKVEDDNDESNEQDNDDLEEEEEDDPLESVIKAEAFEGTRPEATIMVESDTFQQIYESNQSDGKIIDYLKDVKKGEDDEDKQFLMSLIPTFRKLNDKQKFEARIEILKVLKDISFRQECGASSSTS